MNLTRPTLKAIKQLPRESFADSVMYEMVARLSLADSCDFREILKSISFLHISHPLLSDSDSYFSRGVKPDKHRGSSLEGHDVYEVRDRSGAAWRGAVIVPDSVPWLVYAAPHDHFHSEAKLFFKNSKEKALPQKVDLVILERDRDRQKLALDRQKSLLKFLSILNQAVEASNTTVTDTVAVRGAEACVTLKVDSLDDSNISVETAHEAHCDTSLSIRIKISNYEARQDVMRYWVNTLQPDSALVETTCAQGDPDSMVFEIFVSYSHLAQLLADAQNNSIRLSDIKVPQPKVAHYTSKTKLTESIVMGKAVQSLCGKFFIPTRGGEARALPICEECEVKQPIAQRLIDLLLSTQAQS